MSSPDPAAKIAMMPERRRFGRSAGVGALPIEAGGRPQFAAPIEARR